jgi:hypothetical protein
MSTDAQLKGDSLRRQLEASAEYANEHGLDLVENYPLQDIGMSGWDGTNLDFGALGRFRQAIRDGKIGKGSYLLVEAFDRLSRQPPLIALELFIEIINAGVVLVTTSDNQKYTAETTNFQQLIACIVLMSRSNEESARKSDRLKKAWVAKRDNIEQRKLTGKCPGWLRLRRDKKSFEVIEKKAAIVRQLFEDTAAGIGAYTITQRLNKDGVATFGPGAIWRPSTVNMIVSSPSVIGDFQPHRFDKKKKLPDGPPIKGYFPAIIDEALFYSAQSSRLSRRVGGGGRRGEYVSNLFSKIAKCSYCGGRMHFENKGSKGRSYLVCDPGRRGSGCISTRWRYDHFEASFLAFVEELDLGSVFSVEADAVKRAAIESAVSALDGLLLTRKQQRENIFALSEQKGMDVPYVTGKLLECEVKITEIEQKLEEARNQLSSMSAAAASYYESRDQIKELISRVKAKNADNYKTRAQIASRLKSLITRIDVASEGMMPDFKKYAAWAKTKGLKEEPEEFNVAQLRFFRAVFRDGTSRLVYPSAGDPLRFEHQLYTDSESQMKLIRSDGAVARMRWLDPPSTSSENKV